MEVQVSLGDAQGVPGALLQSAVRLALRRGGVAEGEVSVTLLDDVRIREINRTYLSKDRPTDVIAFTLHNEGEPVLGDIYIGHEQVARQARALSVPLAEELARVAIHGTLHVLGYDHTETDARFDSEMFRLQERLLLELLDEAW